MLSEEKLLREEGSSSVSFVHRVFRFMDGAELKVEFEGKRTEDIVRVDDYYRSRATWNLSLYGEDEIVKGSVLISPKGTYNHLGVHIELRGIISTKFRHLNSFPSGSKHPSFPLIPEESEPQVENEVSHTFLCQAQSYEAGTIQTLTRFPFQFGAIKPFESYLGSRIRVEYLIYVKVFRSVKNVSHREYFLVTRTRKNEEIPFLSPSSNAPRVARLPPEAKDSEKTDEVKKEEKLDKLGAPGLAHEKLRMLLMQRLSPSARPDQRSLDIGVSGVLRMEFRFFPTVVDLEGMIFGELDFLELTCRLRSGELALIRRERVSSLALPAMENGFLPSPWLEKEQWGDTMGDFSLEVEKLQIFEVFNGQPFARHTIPFCIPLAAVPRLSPTYENLHHGVGGVRYFLHLSLNTVDGRKFFKEDEIIVYRKEGQEKLTRPRLV